jgi:hypothetical protein
MLQARAMMNFKGPEVLTAAAMNVYIFWSIAPCSPYVNRRFGGTYYMHFQRQYSVQYVTVTLKDLKVIHLK